MTEWRLWGQQWMCHCGRLPYTWLIRKVPVQPLCWHSEQSTVWYKSTWHWSSSLLNLLARSGQQQLCPISLPISVGFMAWMDVKLSELCSMQYYVCTDSSGGVRWQTCQLVSASGIYGRGPPGLVRVDKNIVQETKNINLWSNANLSVLSIKINAQNVLWRIWIA